MGRRKRRVEEPASEGWLATYADTITLLLTFFILLYSMSSIDNQKMKQISQAFQVMMKGETGNTILEYDLYKGKVPLIGGESSQEDNIEETADQIQNEMQLQAELQKLVEANNLTEDVDIIKTDRGIMIELRDNILFESAKSELKDDSKEILMKISGILSKISNQIIVEGHTDTKPINTSKFPSNWELSVDRAVNVVRFFAEDIGLDPARLTAAGYGEYKPVVPNNNEANMSKNRRVNIIIVSRGKE